MACEAMVTRLLFVIGGCRLIQQTIRTQLDGVTCLTIAHRLHTIMDADMVSSVWTAASVIIPLAICLGASCGENGC
jgi:hypothetical protein